MLIAPGTRGVDYAYGDPPVAWFKKHNFYYVVRYLSLPATNSKNFRTSEKKKFLDAGIGILLVWEQASTTPNQGFQRGLLDGSNAKYQADTFGYPIDVPILIAIDTDTYYGNIQAHKEYVKGFIQRAAPYFCGIYGDADILLAVGHECKIGWLPNASGWSSQKREEAFRKGLIHVLQGRQQTIDGYTVDTNTGYLPFPAWSKHSVKPPIPVKIYDPTTYKDDQMEPVRVRYEGYKNVFLYAYNTFTHLTAVSDAKYQKVPLEVWDAHPQGMKSAVEKAGLNLSDLIPE